MAEAAVKVASPDEIRQNPENPRLIFHEEELLELQQSIASNGILVPLTVFQSSEGGYVLLDGERRWRSARKLGLRRVPIIVQPEPSLVQNIMMMFAIHNARSDWDPLPTALKLRKLEDLHTKTEGRAPTESQLAQLASLSRGEVRRLKNILNLPQEYLQLVEEEQELPRGQQSLTVDHLLEVTRGARALVKSDVIDQPTALLLERALIEKFRARALTSTVEPRLLARMARAVSRGDTTGERLLDSLSRLIDDPVYTVRDAFTATVADLDRDHSVELAVDRLLDAVDGLAGSDALTPTLRDALRSLEERIRTVLGES